MSIYQKIHNIMKAVTGVEKDAVNKHASYKYASHDAVAAAVREHMVTEGVISVFTAPIESFRVGQDGSVIMEVCISFIDCEDDSRHDMTVAQLVHTQTKSKTPTAQQCGQAVSYAIKTAMIKTFCLIGMDEPDIDSRPQEGQQAQQNGQQQAKSQAQSGPSAIQEAQKKARDMPPVTVILGLGKGSDPDYTHKAKNGLEASHVLADALKQTAVTYEAGTDMLQWNIAWVSRLDPMLSDRLAQIVELKGGERQMATKGIEVILADGVVTQVPNSRIAVEKIREAISAPGVTAEQGAAILKANDAVKGINPAGFDELDLIIEEKRRDAA